MLLALVLQTVCRSLYSGVFRTLSIQHRSPHSPHLRITSPYTCTSPCEHPRVWWPHNLTLFTTLRRVRAMISRVRQNSRNQATKLLLTVTVFGCTLFCPHPAPHSLCLMLWCLLAARFVFLLLLPPCCSCASCCVLFLILAGCLMFACSSFCIPVAPSCQGF